MEILNIVLTIIISLAGLPIGLLLAKLTQEELKPGKKYFIWLQNILLISAILTLLYSYIGGIIPFIIIAVLIATLIVKSNPRAIMSYAVFFIAFALSIKQTQQLIIISSLIFIYGLPTGALIRLKGLVRYMKEELENPIDPTYRKKIIKKIIYVFWVSMLEVISLPSLFMKNKGHAEWHLKFVCPICPSSRRRHRDVHGKSTCWWESNWRKGNYTIPRHFGMMNWIRQYLKLGTNLKKFRDYDKKK